MDIKMTPEIGLCAENKVVVLGLTHWRYYMIALKRKKNTHYDLL